LGDELALYNKLGDLYLKRGNVASAVEQYEAAVNRYAEQGFPNNAIALCNKVLRNAPGRTHIYLKLATLMMQRGFVSEAKQNLLEYADRMQKAGQVEDAFNALKEFADLSPDNEEIRLLLAEQLKNAARTDEAREQLAKLYQDVLATGDQRRARKTLERMRAIDPDYEIGDDTPAPEQKSKKLKSSDIVFIDLDEDRTPAAAPEPEEPLAVEPTSFGDSAGLDSLEAGSDLDLDRVSDAAVVDPGAADVVQLDGLDVGQTFDSSSDTGFGLDLEHTALADAPEAEATQQSGGDLPLVDEPAADLEDVEIEEIEGLEGREGEAQDDTEAIDEELQVDEWSGGDVTAAGGSGRESSLNVIGADAIESGVEVPELDVDGFEGVHDIEEEEEGVDDSELLADLPLLEEEDATERAIEQESVVTDSETAIETTAVPEGVEPAAEPMKDTEAEDLEAEPSAEAAQGAPPYIAELEAQILDDPADPDPHRRLGEALIELGQRERGLEELDIALSSYEAMNDWQHAQSVADEILRVEPNSVHYHQKRVEYSFRINDRTALASAYLELADALVRSGLLERAQVVYKRVLEHDPTSDRAKSALATLMPDEPIAEPEPERPPPKREATTARPATVRRPTAESFVDLGALVLEEDQERDTRMRIQHDEPTGDEERDFQDMLSEFKKGIDANIDIEDTQAHYDLGVAFREMGLLDEAISEFQKALRGTQERLRTAEALGLCFFDKGQFAVAATVLRRAVDAEPGGDDEKIGLLYWLGRCEEEQGHGSDALSYYQRIFSIDIGFKDVRERVKSLTEASG
jgi:tetratricopeptide (TPR) repeat protein